MDKAQAIANAEAMGMELNEYLDLYQVTLEEGKTAGPPEATPPVDQNQTPAGDSSSGDISLESPEVKGVDLDWKQLFKDEEDVVAALNDQISKYGLIAETANVFSNAVNIRKRQTKKDEQGFVEKYATMVPDLIYKTVTEPFTSIAVGPDRDVKDMLAEINAAVTDLADPDYIEQAKVSVDNELREYNKAVTPEELSKGDLTSEWTNFKAAEYQEIADNATSEVIQPFMFSDEKEYNRFKQWEQDQPIDGPSDEELAEFDPLRKQEYTQKKSAAFINNLEPWQREAIDAVKRNEIETLELDSKNFEQSVADFNVAKEEMAVDIAAFEENPTIEGFDALRKKEAALYDRYESIDKAQESLSQRIEDMPVAIAAIDDASRDYNRLRQLGSNFKSMVPDVMYVTAQLGEALGAGSGEPLKQGAVDLKKSTNKELAGYQKSIEFADMEGLDDVGRWIAGSTTSLIPSLSLAATGSMALPLFFMTGAGGKGIEMAIAEEDAAFRMAKNIKLLEENPDLDWQDKAALEDAIYQDKETLSISPAQKLSAQAAYGIAEVAFERMGTMRILQKLNKATKIAKPKSVVQGVYAASREFLVNANREGASEVATLMLDNMADTYLLNENKNIFDGAGETYAQGALMGTALSLNAPTMVREGLVSELKNRKQAKRLDEIRLKLSELTGINLPNTELGAMGKFGNQTPAVRKMIEELTAEAEGIKDEILENFAAGNLSVDELTRVGEHNRKMREINQELRDAAADSEVKPAELKALRDELQQKFNAEKEARDVLLEGVDGVKAEQNKISFEAQSGYAAYEGRMFNEGSARLLDKFGRKSKSEKQQSYANAKAALEAEGKTPTNREIETRAIVDYVESQNKQQLESGSANAKAYAARKDNDLNVEFIEVDGPNAIEQMDKALDKLYNEGRISSENYKSAKAQNKATGSFDGVNLTDISEGGFNDIILVNKTVAAKNGRVGVYAHELLHSEFKERVKKQGGNIDAIGQEFLDFLKANHPDVHAKITARLEAVYQDGDGNVDLEEAMNALSDLLSEGETLNQGIVDYIKTMINRVFGRNTFKDGKSTFYFVRDFNKASHFGGKNKVRPTFKQGVAQPEEEDGKFSISASADRAKQVLEKVSSNMDFFDPNSPLIARVLPGMIEAQLVPYINKGLKVDKEEAVSDVLMRLYTGGEIGKYNGKGTLYGYLNGRIKYRILDAFKNNSALVEDFAQSDIEDLKGAAADVTTIEQTEERAEAERPTYKTLTERKVVEPEVMETIKGKLPRIVGTLKNKIDAPVSKNKTVTPLVNELRLALGKQIDIDLKKAMGGKKDGQLRKWLQKNRKAILENMTTTYLMTAMPNAIQKKVDGVWTSDWAGKKIDRESVATDNAGRTSGAELVRRLPQASLKISEADFLANILEPSGNPIRGRKESLAKAIAEELAIEMVNAEMQNPESQVYQAFEANQERLGVELADNFVTKLALDLERGNVKYSISNLQTVADLLELKRTQPNNRSEHEALLNTLPKDLRDEVDNFTNNVLGTNKGQFISTMREMITQMATNESGKVDEEKLNEKFLSFLEMYGNVETNNKRPEFKATEKLVMSFNKKLLNKLHPAIVGRIGSQGFFGLNKKNFIDPANHKDFAAKLARKKNTGKKINKTSSLEFDIADVHLLDDNSSIVKGIKEVQLKNIPKEAKEKEIEAKYGDQIRKLNVANPKMFAHIMAKVFDLALQDENNVIGLMAILQQQSSIRGPLTALTTLTDIELFDGTQGAYINLATGEGSFEPKEGFVENTNHPLWSAANAFAKNSKHSPVKLLTPYREHGWPQSKQMAFVMGALANALQIVNGVQPSLANKNVFVNSVSKLAVDFNQQLNSLLASSIQDKKFGKTSEVGDFRLLSLPDVISNAFYDVDAKKPTNDRLKDVAKAALPSLTQSDVAYIGSRALLQPGASFSKSVPQAIFMVGGPGAGKSNVVKELDLINKGYRLVNQDPILEALKRESGLPADEKTYDKEQRSLRAKLGWKARKEAQEYMDKLRDSKESMIVDGTGASYNATTKKMKALEAAGFEVHMIFVNTSKDVAVKRNRARVERSLADFIVTKTWDSVQESSAKYREDYAGRFYEINTDNLAYGQSLPKPFAQAVDTGLNASKAKFSKSLNTQFNEMIERTKGVSSTRVFSSVQAKMLGEKIGKYRLFVPASAEDFRGLTAYSFAGKGKQGEADQKFFEENIINPYVAGVARIDAVKQQIRREYHAAAKANKPAFKLLGKKISNTKFTYDQALRVYLWTQQGIEIPGMDKDDTAFLINEINQNPQLIELGNAMMAISRQDTWIEPNEHWMGHTLVSELNSMTEKVGRKKYLEQFIENVDVIFSNDNLNKIEAIYGSRHRAALEDAIYSMKNGRNRPSGANAQVNAWSNWVNNSTGAIMFFNIRSAVLQTLSATNFINWSDNNPVKAAAAFANQKQYWSDFAMIFNSDKLKQRRSGLQTDVNAAEIANQAEGAQNKAAAVISYLLKVGFTPTQMADSFAIGMGGASFYRNRANTYIKEGFTKEEAEAKAFEDFSKTADEAQQSSDPYLVSQEQRSPLGRLVLAFQNTPMQYTRLMKKAGQDLIAGRGDAKTHISKIIYYGAVQNFVFSALQSALFAMIPGLDDDDEELDEKALAKKERKEDEKILRIINSMTDSILKGSGVAGAVLATIKNTITEYFKQEEKGFTADHTYTILQAISLSPPIGSKARKIYSSIQGTKFNKDVLEAEGFNVMSNGRVNLSPAYSIIGSLVSGVANVPMDRMVDIITSYSEALDERNKTWQRIALALGWKTWDVGAKNEEHDLIKAEAKARRKEEGKIKAKKTRESKKKQKQDNWEAEQMDRLMNPGKYK